MKRNEFDTIDDIFGSILETFFPVSESVAKELNVSTPLRTSSTETENTYEVLLEVPGVKQEQIDVQFKDDIVSVKVDYGTENKLRAGKYGWSHKFKGVDASGISAKLADGVLMLTLTKKPEMQSQKININ